MSPIVVLIGVPGAGKTTTGAELAQQLGVSFTDTDDVVEKRAGKTVSDIFIADGEDVFRAYEHDAVVESVQQVLGVLALGGGAILDQRCRAAIAGLPVVWLRVNSEVAMKRIGMSVARPAFLGNVRGQMTAMMKERTPLYEEVATITLDVDEVEPAEAAQQIIAALKVGSAQ